MIFGPYNVRYYPSDIRNIASKESRKKTSFNESRLYDLFDYQPGTDRNEAVNLAGIPVKMDDIEDIWNEKITSGFDSESINLAHRFHWLIEEIASNASYSDLKRFYKMVLNWHKIVHNREDSIAFSPYNVSERICNLTVFSCIAFKHNCLHLEDYKTIKCFIQEDLLRLKNILEYPASGKVNNHILNNARALYIGGAFLNSFHSMRIARSIFERHLPEMISENGYLNESSSHYQFLLTKNIQEVSIFAKACNHSNFHKFIKRFSESMLEASKRLIPSDLVKINDIPKIGDVSPDIPIDWFELNSSGQQGTWNKLWNKSFESKTSISEISHLDGWIAAQKYDWFLLAHSHPSKELYPLAHGHRDFGSFVLYDKGLPIFTDIGRGTYDNPTDNKNIGYESNAHSTVMINNREPLFTSDIFKTIFPPDSKCHSKEFRLMDEYKFEWSVSEDDFIWNRTILMEDQGRIKIVDSFQAKRIEGYLYFSEGISIEDFTEDKIKIRLTGGSKYLISLKNIDSFEIDDAEDFTSYGKRSHTKRLRWIKEIKQRKEETELMIERQTN